jgi:hypothetical protein
MTMIHKSRFRLAIGLLAVIPTLTVHAQSADAVPPVEPDVVVCTPVGTAAQLSRIRNNLAGTYCLTKDIDLGSIANFEPIGNDITPFTGRLYGNGHVIKNLTIDTEGDLAGLFGVVSGTIQDVALVDVNINASGGFVGGLAGLTTAGSTIARISVTGEVASIKDTSIGGVLGILAGTISESLSAAKVTGGFSVSAGALIGVSEGAVQRCSASGAVAGGSESHLGGLIGQVIAGTVEESYASGAVAGGGTQTGLGGLIGLVGGSAPLVQLSYATGPISGSSSGGNFVGGLIGVVNTGTVRASYASGPVSEVSREAGGLIGHLGTATVDQAYASGHVSGGIGVTVGGLVATTSGSPTVTDSYWDAQTSGQTTSGGGLGTGMTTAQLRAALPAGFGNAWAITPTYSYPFLNDPAFDFTSPLATSVLASKIFTFLPIGQLDHAQYINQAAHGSADQASLAAVYTMIARAIGLTDNVRLLKDAKIDRFFWHDRTQTATFSGPVTAHASIGAFTPIAARAPLNDNNVVGKLKANRLVILRGSYRRPNGATGKHWLLATLFTSRANGAVVEVVGNDPWIGEQVTINLRSKTVTSPADFPLNGFKVDGYQAVVFN